MNSFERMLRSRTMIALLRARLGFLSASWLLAACTAAHMEGSTETGNPPVIDVQKVALVVANTSVKIVGQPGAVSPGGATVEITIVGTGEVVSRASNADGSFEIPLTASADAVVEVRATAGDERSRAVYVTQGGASVGSGAGATLSCMERTNLASQAAASLVNNADTSCQTTADCAQVSSQTQCTDSCSDAVVAGSAVAGIRAGLDAINRDICGNFAGAGCSVIAQPCVPPPQGPIACVAGQCRQEPEPAPSCPSCLGETLSWGPTSRQTTNTISNCDSFARTTTGSASCEGAVAHCGGSGDKASVEELITALRDPDVQAALGSGELVGGPPAPGGLSTSVSFGSRSFTISNCGANCTNIPAGVQRLSALLDRVATETDCQPPACPPNSVYVTDYCAQCGAAGGCVTTEARCAVVCTPGSDVGACAGMGNGVLCTSRGICEVGLCI